MSPSSRGQRVDHALIWLAQKIIQSFDIGNGFRILHTSMSVPWHTIDAGVPRHTYMTSSYALAGPRKCV